MNIRHFIPERVVPYIERGVTIDGEHLTIDQIIAVARYGAPVRIADEVRPRVDHCRQYVEQAALTATDPTISEKKKKDWLIYGITTGFGNMKDFPVKSLVEAEQLQQNIIYSHAVGVGNCFDVEIVRAMLLLRANAFAQGHSGIRYTLLEFLIALLNSGVHPLIPEQGSVGASGDLCPLAHMALILIGHGHATIGTLNKTTFTWKSGPIISGKEALASIQEILAKLNISIPFSLSFKEGLALTNGTTAMAAIATLTYFDAVELAKHADLSSAMSLETIAGRTRAFDHKVHEIRPHPGQQACAANIRAIVAGSKLVDQNRDVQDSYAIRCIPQVHGATRDTLEHVRRVLDVEINAVTDNPLFFEPDPDVTDGLSHRREYSAGNFHGQPLALIMDFLGIALAELGSISERRIQKLLDANHNHGLPTNLAVNPGLNSGLMILQYTAAALVSENKVLAHPACVDSIPTSSNIEDHVSMGAIAARKARQILTHVQQIIAIEFLVACQGLDFRVGTFPTEKDDRIFLKEAVEIQREMDDAESTAISTHVLTDILRIRYRLKHIHIDSVRDLGKGTRIAFKTLREHIPAVERDEKQELHQHIQMAWQMIKQRSIIAPLEKSVALL
ncbi:histidine ammonia-lyase [candidate division KSB1 bacterium]|nr:histidine ammonia-lyase [candidate division KSB1 bacterium]